MTSIRDETEDAQALVGPGLPTSTAGKAEEKQPDGSSEAEANSESHGSAVEEEGLQGLLSPGLLSGGGTSSHAPEAEL